MQRKKRINPMKYFLVLVITLAVFLSGIYLGNYSSNQKIELIGDMQNDLRIKTLGVELQYEILAENPCLQINSTPLTEELNSIAERLDFMENQLGEDNIQVINTKEYYSLLQIRHWLLLKRTKEECKHNTLPIFYFYSNRGDCPDCDEQGIILTAMRKKYDFVRVYPFDINIQNPAISTLRSMYAVEKAPTLIIDDQFFDYYLPKLLIEEMITNYSKMISRPNIIVKEE